MKKITRLFALIMALCMILSFAACSTKETGVSDETENTPGSSEEQEEKEEEDTTITVTDMIGQEIVLSEPVTRIIALTAADCEILYAIGAGDCLVGRGEYCDYPAQVLDVQSVQSGYETNIEQIIALAPQVVLMGTMDQTEEQITALENAGIQVVVSDADDIDGVYTAIEMIGTIMGKEAEAESVIEGMKSVFSSIEAGVFEGGKTVYFEVSPLEWGLWAAGSGTFMNEIAEMMGLKNCFDDVEGWVEVSEEQVLERNPDYIVTISMYYGEGPTPVEEILGRSGWENITAVKNNAVLNLQDNELSRPGPRLADGASMLYDFVSESSDAADAA